MHEEPADVPRPRSTRRAANATIYDIAEYLGVSASTVSRALTLPGRLNARTEAKVRAAAAELGYVPNPAARALQTGRSGSVAIMFPDLGDPLWAEAVVAAETTAAAAARNLLIGDAERSPGIATALSLAAATDGIVLVDSDLDDAEIQDLDAQYPTISVGRIVPGVRSLMPDLAPGVDAALLQLRALGHHSIAYVRVATASRMRVAIAEVVAARAAALGIHLDTIPLTDADFAAASERVRALGVTAVIAQNDLVAIAILQAVQARGVLVPASLSIIGIDDLFVSALVSPGISSIRLPLPELVERAVRTVVVTELGAAAPDNLPSTFISRGSVGAVAATTPARSS